MIREEALRYMTDHWENLFFKPRGIDRFCPSIGDPDFKIVFSATSREIIVDIQTALKHGKVVETPNSKYLRWKWQTWTPQAEVIALEMLPYLRKRLACGAILRANIIMEQCGDMIII